MKIKDNKSTRIQGEGNSIQYIFNEEIIENFNTCLLQLTEKFTIVLLLLTTVCLFL